MVERRCTRSTVNQSVVIDNVKGGDILVTPSDHLNHFCLSLLQLQSQKSNLEEQLKSTTVDNISLTSEMQRVNAEMTSVRSRLLTTLNELDVCKEKQVEDERKLLLLRQKFAAMEEQ